MINFSVWMQFYLIDWLIIIHVIIDICDSGGGGGGVGGVTPQNKLRLIYNV